MQGLAAATLISLARESLGIHYSEPTAITPLHNCNLSPMKSQPKSRVFNSAALGRGKSESKCPCAAMIRRRGKYENTARLKV